MQRNQNGRSSSRRQGQTRSSSVGSQNRSSRREGSMQPRQVNDWDYQRGQGDQYLRGSSSINEGIHDYEEQYSNPVENDYDYDFDRDDLGEYEELGQRGRYNLSEHEDRDDNFYGSTRSQSRFGHESDEEDYLNPASERDSRSSRPRSRSSQGSYGQSQNMRQGSRRSQPYSRHR